MGKALFYRLRDGIERRVYRAGHNRRLLKLAADIQNNRPAATGKPVVLFNASTRLSGLSLNAAYSLLTAWALRLSGVRVIHFYCRQGLPLCVLGTSQKDVQKAPPCLECIRQSQVLFSGGEAVTFELASNPALEERLQGLSIPELMEFWYDGIPLGNLVLPSVRWVLRRHTLENDTVTRHVFTRYILGAWNISVSFSSLLDREDPQAVLVFNGMSYPEAAARWAAQQRGIRVITHEVCLMPFSAFFSDGDATLRVIDIPEHFELSPEQNRKLDEYLDQRFKGNFKMAGVRFWKDMQNLDATWLEKARSFKQTVTIFSNVIFDTSQSHANTIFSDMFAWLDYTLTLVQAHPETLFVYRAHPDEGRPGKESRESVAGWAKHKSLDQYENVIFIPSDQRISSYELIRHSKFIMVYNSTIGLEASLLDAAVLCAGRSRFTDYPTVFFPRNVNEFSTMAESFLQVSKIEVPEIFKSNARRYLFYELYKASLPFESFLKEDPYWQGYVTLKDLSWKDLLPANSLTMSTIVDGICFGKPFLLNN